MLVITPDKLCFYLGQPSTSDEIGHLALCPAACPFASCYACLLTPVSPFLSVSTVLVRTSRVWTGLLGAYL